MTSPSPSAGWSLGALLKEIISHSPGEVRKFLTAVLGVAGIALSQGLIQGTAAKWVSIGIGLVTALGVYYVPNAQPTPSTVPLDIVPPAPPSTPPTPPSTPPTPSKGG